MAETILEDLDPVETQEWVDALSALEVHGGPERANFVVNAVVDALAHLGVRHIDIPITPEKVWRILKDKGVAE